MPDNEDVFGRDDSGPPADWKPSWERWQEMKNRGRELAKRLGQVSPRVTELETQLATATQELEAIKATHATELGKLRAQIEDGEIRTIPGLVEPDPQTFRAQYQVAMASLPEAQLVSFKDWSAAQVTAATTAPDEAPRWLRGFLGDGPPPASIGGPGADAKGAPKPPADQHRRPPPAPKGGYTAEQVERMTPEEFTAHQEQLVAQLNRGS